MRAFEQTIAKQIDYKQNPKNSPNYFLPRFNTISLARGDEVPLFIAPSNNYPVNRYYLHLVPPKTSSRPSF
ncbi:hypothetical protein TRIATDRAFT_258244 [Trichoderma atroviride IMI 206040]|uniref:Uncharacterized protein n=1 Tax=Hypocrea atroviridis (strain ATCC 20476 / IMI 206040) TaxID=452589 RepID=G9P3D9_HYPAI|nr:uncharacterized protein TRIATDRAFT_258244 [Trichoderma atroviride IMI 206040]EHK42898.1 hypothetical protein TRIATDRAFT_258244 [Trichoderma atroviride IMI 206040]